MKYLFDMTPNPPFMWVGDFQHFLTVCSDPSSTLFILVGCVAGEPPADAWAFGSAHDVNVANEWIGHDPKGDWTTGKVEESLAPPQSLTYLNLINAFLHQQLPVVLFMPIKSDHPAMLADCLPKRQRLMSQHVGEYLKRENHPRYADWLEAHTYVFGEVELK